MMYDNNEVRIKNLEEEVQELRKWKESVEPILKLLSNSPEIAKLREQERVREEVLKETQKRERWESIQADAKFYFHVRPRVLEIMEFYDKFYSLCRKKRVYGYAVARRLNLDPVVYYDVVLEIDDMAKLKEAFEDEIEISRWNTSVEGLRKMNEEVFSCEDLLSLVLRRLDENCKKLKNYEKCKEIIKEAFSE